MGTPDRNVLCWHKDLTPKYIGAGRFGTDLNQPHPETTRTTDEITSSIGQKIVLPPLRNEFSLYPDTWFCSLVWYLCQISRDGFFPLQLRWVILQMLAILRLTSPATVTFVVHRSGVMTYPDPGADPGASNEGGDIPKSRLGSRTLKRGLRCRPETRTSMQGEPNPKPPPHIHPKESPF